MHFYLYTVFQGSSTMYHYAYLIGGQCPLYGARFSDMDSLKSGCFAFALYTRSGATGDRTVGWKGRVCYLDSGNTLLWMTRLGEEEPVGMESVLFLFSLHCIATEQGIGRKVTDRIKGDEKPASKTLLYSSIL